MLQCISLEVILSYKLTFIIQQPANSAVFHSPTGAGLHRSLCTSQIRSCDLCMSYLIVMLNVKEICCVTKAWCLVEVTKIAPKVGIINNSFLVAFEMTNIDWIKSN